MSTEIVSLQTNKIITLLHSEEKKRRSEALKQILNLMKSNQSKESSEWSGVKECNESTKHSSFNSSELWDSISKPLLRILNDPVEECRDLTLEILQLFLKDSPPDDKYINYLFPILNRRLGSSEQIETSEEVRLKSVLLIKTIINKYEELLSTYVDDLTSILINTAKDNYPIIKKESCESIQMFAKCLTRLFYYQSKNFVKPVLVNFSHQHYRVRSVAVKTIGEIIQFGDGKLVEEVAQPLAERLFDQNGIVRKAVIEVAGSWLLKLRDRYSWWHRIIPLLLTGLHDELEEIRMRSAELWKQVGLQYMKENETDEKLKDKMDFLTENLPHYPKVMRPNLGCRTIAQQSFGKLLNGMILELSDWIADIRVRTAQLLCVFVLHLEEDITQHIGKILGPMYRACNDEDKRVVENLERACEYMGYFVLPQTYFSLIVPTLEENLSVGHLRVFSSILKGSERSKLKPFLKDVAHFLAQPHICQSRSGEYQKELLACCSSLISACDEVR
ncbi:dynein assembly factor 5, axonemal-like [Ceratina calcarata]|uniref:Dynein assembly factor 5, axonemal-like n=1 Tax=Ceratina calcarata TaxID=156304 RepID=A0AAJ7J899_9HYME|nr:dynein assembly factor 5, axonemal-like [Ceratina calcarata]